MAMAVAMAQLGPKGSSPSKFELSSQLALTPALIKWRQLCLRGARSPKSINGVDGGLVKAKGVVVLYIMI